MVAVESTQLQQGRMLTLDAKNAQFKGDKEANALLTRQYRAPFVVPSRLA